MHHHPVAQCGMERLLGVFKLGLPSPNHFLFLSLTCLHSKGHYLGYIASITCLHSKGHYLGYIALYHGVVYCYIVHWSHDRLWYIVVFNILISYVALSFCWSWSRYHQYARHSMSPGWRWIPIPHLRSRFCEMHNPSHYTQHIQFSADISKNHHLYQHDSLPINGCLESRYHDIGDDVTAIHLKSIQVTSASTVQNLWLPLRVHVTSRKSSIFLNNLCASSTHYLLSGKHVSQHWRWCDRNTSEIDSSYFCPWHPKYWLPLRVHVLRYPQAENQDS